MTNPDTQSNEQLDVCKICGEKATGIYEGYPVCDTMRCEYRIQEGLDYMKELGAR